MADTNGRKHDSPTKAEEDGLCTACNGTGSIPGLNDYPGAENRKFCSHCEAGRQLINRIVEFAAQTRLEERLRRNGYQHSR